MPEWLQSLILGIVQGITEFVPVSSSGHLVLLPYLAGWERPGLAFDVALHIGTALAVTVYFRTELLGMAGAVLGRGDDATIGLYRRLVVLLVIGSVPVAIVGLAAKDFVEQIFASPLAASGFLLVTAGLLVLGERVRSARTLTTAPPAAASDGERRVWTGDWRGSDAPSGPVEEPLADLETGTDPSDPKGLDLRRIGPREALIVGLFQCLALFPGISRSGSTITAGIIGGMTRQAATRFSFLLALPAMVGAALVSVRDLGEAGPYSLSEVGLGVLAAFVAGYFAISWLVKLVARTRLTIFVRYLIAVAAIGAFGYVMTGPPSAV